MTRSSVVKQAENRSQTVDSFRTENFYSTVSVDKDGPEPSLTRTLQITDVAIADVKNVRRLQLVLTQRGIKDLRVWFSIANAARQKNVLKEGTYAQSSENSDQA